jgi:AAA+ ATPase superfamily predicted ATPase
MSEFKPITNPYIVGNPIKTEKMFYGREDDFEYIKRKVESGGKSYIIVLCGERRSGKTSILFQILNGRLGDDFMPILIDMQTMAGLHSEGEFFEKFTIEIQKAVNNTIKVENYNFKSSDESAYKVFSQVLDDFHTAFADKNKIFLIDEYELIESKAREGSLTKNFIPFLSGVLESERKMSFIFTGSKKLEERDTKFWHILFGKSLFRNVSFLSEQDTMRLITEPVQGEIEFDKHVLSSIYRLTSGQPFYTQVVCQNMVDFVNERQNKQIKKKDLDGIVDEILENPLPQMIYFWNSLPGSQKLGLSLLSESLENADQQIGANEIIKISKKRGFELELSVNKISTTFEALYYHNHLLKSGNNYHFQMDLFRQWIKRDHSIWRVMKEVGTDFESEVDNLPSKTILADEERPKSVSGNKKWMIPAAAVAVIAVLFIFWFTRDAQPPEQTDLVSGEQISPPLQDNRSDVAENSLRAMQSAEKEAAKNKAASQSPVYASAMQSKTEALKKFENKSFDEAIELFQQAENQFLEVSLFSPEPETTTPTAAAERRNASNSRLAMVKAKNRARNLNATQVTSYKTAQAKESSAESDFKNGKYQSARSLYREATSLFKKASDTRQANLRNTAISAQNTMQVIKKQSDQSGASSTPNYRQASQKEQEATASLRKNDYETAAGKFREAEKLYRSAESTMKADDDKIATDAKRFQEELSQIKARVSSQHAYLDTYTQAKNTESVAESHINRQNFSEAVPNLQRSIELYQKAIEEHSKDVEQVNSMIGQYRKSLENENIVQMKRLRGDFTQAVQDQWSQFFDVVDDLKVNVSVTNLSFEKSMATASLDVRMAYKGAGGSGILNKWRIELAESASDWIIIKVSEKN